MPYDTNNQDDSLSHAHAEDWNLAAIVLDSRIANACIALWMSRSGTDYQLGRILCDQLFDSDLIVSVYSHGRAFEDEVLIHVPGEGVVVVNEYNVGSGRYWWRGGGVVGRMVNQCEGRQGGWFLARMAPLESGGCYIASSG